MKSETIQALYDDYKEYQEWYYQNHGWIMEETFREYVQRCIDKKKPSVNMYSVALTTTN
jgi:lysyl-tRNA synthetase class I